MAELLGPSRGGLASAHEPALDAQHRELVQFLDRIDQEVRSYRMSINFDKDASLWVQARNGALWGQRGEEPVFMANVLGNLIERKTAQLTQSKPDIRVASRNAQLTPMAHVISDTARAVLDGIQLDARVETGADLAATFGFVGFNTAWNPHVGYGAGDIQLEVLDGRRFFVDHHVKDPADIQRAQYIRIDKPMPLDDVRRTWPERGAMVQANQEAPPGWAPGAVSSWISMAGRRVLRPFQGNSGPYEWVTVSEYWLRSGQVDRDGTALFPNGRVIHRCGKVVLDDRANPYWDGLWPVDVWDWRVNGEHLLGRSDVNEGVKLQETMNRVGNAVAKNIILNSAITVIGDYNALAPEDWKKLDNRAARILRKQPGRDLDFITPPPIPDVYLNYMTMTTSILESLLGVPPAMQGRRQPGVIASSAIEGLMTQAETLIRAAARRLEYVIERIGQKLISRIIQFYDGDRILLMNGPDGDVQQYLFKRAEMLGTYLDGAESEEDREDRLRELHTNFVFKVIPLSSLPSNKVQRGLMAMQLLQAGLIPADEAVRMMELPDGKYLLQKAQAETQQSQEAGLQKSMQMQLMGVDPTKVPGGGPGGKGPRASRDGTKLKP